MPHITYEYTVPRVSSTPASFTQDQHPISSMMANTSYPQLPITGNEVEDRREKSKGTTLDHKGTMEARGDVRWEHQAPCNLSENSEALRLRESGKQDSFGEHKMSSVFLLSYSDSEVLEIHKHTTDGCIRWMDGWLCK